MNESGNQGGELLDELQRFEAAGDIIGALQLVVSRNLSLEELTQLTFSAYGRNIDGVCWALFDKLKPHLGLDNLAALSLLLSSRIGNELDVEAHFEQLHQAVSKISADGALNLFSRAEPYFAMSVIQAFWKSQRSVLKSIGCLVETLNPGLGEVFSKEKSDTRHPESDKNRDLLPFHHLRPPQERIRRKALVVMRQYFFPSEEKSQRFDAGLRICGAMENYGWDAELFELKLMLDDVPLKDKSPSGNLLSGILEHCKRTEIDLLILDQLYISQPVMIWLANAVRREIPGAKLALVYFDPWDDGTWEMMENVAEYAHAVWSPFPSLPLWEKPSFTGKMCFVPMPSVWMRQAPLGKLVPEMTFSGGVHPFNWYRGLWLSALHEEGMPVKRELWAHIDDGLDPLASFHNYMEKVGRAGACLSFSMRLGGSKNLTGRTFEVLQAGGLLVQEECDDVGNYLIPWRHYIPFRTLGDLFDIYKLLREAPERCEKIRLEGHRHALDHYSDQAIIGHIDGMLFG